MYGRVRRCPMKLTSLWRRGRAHTGQTPPWSIQSALDSIGVILYLFGSASAPPNAQLSTPDVDKEVGQIWSEIRIDKDFDGTLSIFIPLSTPNQFSKVTAVLDSTEL